MLASGAALLAAPAKAADYIEAMSAAYGARVDPLELHRLAFDEMGRLWEEADPILRRLGFVNGEVSERLRAFAADDTRVYPDTDAGRVLAVADMNGWLARKRPLIESAFQGLNLPEPEVRRPAPENLARGGYREPPIYYVDLRNLAIRPRWTLASVAFHETIPGHALQAAVAGGPRPAIFSEAWATYAEQLMDDLGAYDADPEDRLGYIHWRMFRMVRTLADVGMGFMGWRPDDAVNWGTKLQGFSIAFTTIEADVARMAREPGVFAAQGLGALAIASARPRRRRYWPAFHRAILADGAWPVAMLAQPGAGARR